MDKEKWNKARAAEFEYHSRGGVRADKKRWLERSRLLFEGLGVDCRMSGKRILDIGSGPVLRTSIFVGRNQVVALDPLIHEYMGLPFCDVQSVEHYDLPAEELVPQLVNRFDIAFCLNVLDHCYQPRAVLKRAGEYLKRGGLFYLWTDIGSCDEIHEGDMTVAEISRWLTDAGFDILRLTEGVDPLRFVETDEPDYFRCGVRCAPGISCVVVKAVRAREPTSEGLETLDTEPAHRLEILESRVISLSRRLKHLESHQRRIDRFLAVASIVVRPVRRIMPARLLEILDRKFSGARRQE